MLKVEKALLYKEGFLDLLKLLEDESLVLGSVKRRLGFSPSLFPRLAPRKGYDVVPRNIFQSEIARIILASNVAILDKVFAQD